MCIERTVVNGLYKNKYECECVYIPFAVDSLTPPCWYLVRYGKCPLINSKLCWLNIYFNRNKNELSIQNCNRAKSKPTNYKCTHSHNDSICVQWILYQFSIDTWYPFSIFELSGVESSPFPAYKQRFLSCLLRWLINIPLFSLSVSLDEQNFFCFCCYCCCRYRFCCCYYYHQFAIAAMVYSQTNAQLPSELFWWNSIPQSTANPFDQNFVLWTLIST